MALNPFRNFAGASGKGSSNEFRPLEDCIFRRTFSTMTAPARLPAKTKKPLRAHAKGRPVLLPFPVAAAGQVVSVGLGNWEAYLALDEALCRRGFRVRYH